MDLPLISIITVVLNSVDCIENTIQSVINQTYPNKEYIIIDGGSTDGTLDIIKKYDGHINYFVSEPDKGIYDAMNKGIKYAKGDKIIFLGAGDCFYNNEVLTQVAPFLNKYDFVYGNVILKSPVDSKEIIYDGKFSSYKLTIKNICHQGIFYDKGLFTKYGHYDLMYKIWADYEFNLRVFRKTKKKYLNLIIAINKPGGISQQREDELFKQKRLYLINKYLGVHYCLLYLSRKWISHLKNKLISFLK